MFYYSLFPHASPLVTFSSSVFSGFFSLFVMMGNDFAWLLFFHYRFHDLLHFHDVSSFSKLVVTYLWCLSRFSELSIVFDNFSSFWNMFIAFHYFQDFHGCASFFIILILLMVFFIFRHFMISIIFTIVHCFHEFSWIPIMLHHLSTCLIFPWFS